MGYILRRNRKELLRLGGTEGYTVLELLIVLIIVGILVMLVVWL